MDKHVSAGENLGLGNKCFPRKNSEAEYQQIFPRLLAKAEREGDLAKGDLLSIPVCDVYLCSCCKILSSVPIEGRSTCMLRPKGSWGQQRGLCRVTGCLGWAQVLAQGREQSHMQQDLFIGWSALWMWMRKQQSV